MAKQLVLSDSGRLETHDGDAVTFGSVLGGVTFTQTYSTADDTITAPTTDSTGGTAQAAAAAGVGKYLLTVPVNLATVADGDVLTSLPIPHKFKILSVDAYVTQEVTTADKLTTLNVEIGTTNLTGGAVALTSANCATLGAKVAGSAITAANTGAADAAISIEAASTTAFAEGQVMVVIGIQNMDVADAFAALIEDITDNRQYVNQVVDVLQAADA